MIVSTVKWYKCEFCKKGTRSSGATKKHEKHCTLNPNRECRVCKLLTQTQPALSDLIAVIPKQLPTCVVDWPEGYKQSLKDTLDKIRVLADGCPACIFSAIRQGGNEHMIWCNYNYKNEMKSIFQSIADEQYERGYY